MISKGADPHIRDSDGLTPADLAEECNYNECAIYLRNQPDKPSVVKHIEPAAKVEDDEVNNQHCRKCVFIYYY